MSEANAEFSRLVARAVQSPPIAAMDPVEKGNLISRLSRLEGIEEASIGDRELVQESLANARAGVRLSEWLAAQRDQEDT